MRGNIRTSVFLAPYANKVVSANSWRVIWRWMRACLFDSYHPELHYMRGPGPKWREKHGYALRMILGHS
jgi:hypothetical protein